MCVHQNLLMLINLSSCEPSTTKHQSKKVTIGQTTALIPEAGSAVKSEWIIDGKSGNTNFPYAEFKALATVGEVDSKVDVR